MEKIRDLFQWFFSLGILVVKYIVMILAVIMLDIYTPISWFWWGVLFIGLDIGIYKIRNKQSAKHALDNSDSDVI